MLRFIHLLFLSLIFLFDAAWADEQPAIVYGADEAFRPYEWFSDEGNLEGFQIELIRAIGEAQGRRISFVTGPWSKIRQSLLDGSVQVVSMFDQPVRRIYADFSKPHSVLASEIFVRIGSKPILSVQELAGKEVIQQEGALSAEYLRTLGIRYTSIQVKDQFDAMRLLATGKHDCVITTQVGGRYALQKLGIRNIITTGQPLLASNVAFAVRKGNSALLEWLNSGLDRVKANGTYDVLYQKWFGESNRFRMSDLQAMRNVFVGIGLAIVVLVAVIGLWIKMLRRAVSTKTFELQYLADHDSLTGLYNRHYITNAIHSAIADFHLHSGQRNFGILFIDLDRFKLVNDSLGHHVGDLLIKAVGFELLASVEDRCRVARWGGDEFIVLVNPVGDGAALQRIAMRIAEKLRTPYNFKGKDIFIGASIGAVMSSLRYRTAEEMLRDADNAMYRAKSDRRVSVRLFEPQMHDVAVRNLKLSSDFQKGVARGELRNHYQPIYSLATGKLSGFEALVRWQHPELGLLSPAVFLPILEKTEAMRQLGEWVLQNAIETAKRWHHHYAADFYISVNISDEQFAFGNLCDTLSGMLEKFRLPPRFLRLEITETVLMADVVGGMSQLEELRQMQVRILIDDFGTGFSSLSHLASIPAETIKIDRSFVHGLVHGSRNYEIVRAMLALTRNLHLEAVAEGIETRHERDLLAEMGCEYAQGFFYSEPLIEMAAEELLKKITVQP